MSQAQHDRLVWCARVCVLSVAMVSQYMMNGVVVSVCVCVWYVSPTRRGDIAQLPDEGAPLELSADMRTRTPTPNGATLATAGDETRPYATPRHRALTPFSAFAAIPRSGHELAPRTASRTHAVRTPNSPACATNRTVPTNTRGEHCE